MLTLLAVCVGSGVALWRVERFVRDRQTRLDAAAERRLAIEERKLALEERRLASTLEPEEVPADLRVRYELETEPWARDQMRSLIRELHNEYRNWDSVRQALGQLDTQVAHREPGWSQTQVLS